jgi:hypothetical protein
MSHDPRLITPLVELRGATACISICDLRKNISGQMSYCLRGNWNDKSSRSPSSVLCSNRNGHIKLKHNFQEKQCHEKRHLGSALSNIH